jgi:hypothetical protein
MRYVPLLVCAAAAAITACSSGIKVRSTVAPDASFSGLSSYYVLTPPVRSAKIHPRSEYDSALFGITTEQLAADAAKWTYTGGAPAETTATMIQSRTCAPSPVS